MSAPQAQTGTLYRAPMRFERDFTQLPNDWLRDVRLSRGARGLLAELMTHSAGFQLSVAGLVLRGREGRDAVRKFVAELEAHGYLRREKQGRKGNRFGGIVWTLMDPRDAIVTGSQSSGFQTAENQPAENQTAGFLQAENPPLRTPISKTLINGDFPEQPSVAMPVPVDNSQPACNHPQERGRCLYACRADFERRQRS